MEGKRYRALILDDEASVRLPLQARLQARNWHVGAAENGAEALRFLQDARGDFDVVVVDQVLAVPPSGMDTLRAIKVNYPDIECIMLTGWGGEGRQEAVAAGAFRYLEKGPRFSYDELMVLMQKAAEQRRLRAAAREIQAEHSVDGVVNRSIQAVRTLLGADQAAVVLLQENGRLEIHHLQGNGVSLWKQHLLEGQLTRELIRTGQIAYFRDTHQEPAIHPDVIASGIQALMGTPIPHADRNIGVLYAYSEEQGKFDAWEAVDTLQQLARHVGQAYSTATAFGQVEKQACYMEALVQTGQRLAQTSDEVAQFELAWDFVRHQLNVRTFSVALYDRESDRLTIPLAYDNGRPVQPDLDRTLGKERAGWGISGWVAKTGKERYWPTAAARQAECAAAGITAIAQGRPCESCLFVPLKAGNRVLGVLSVQAYEPQAFSPALLDAIRALASQLATSLANARLLSAERRRAEQFAALSRVVKAISRPSKREPLLRSIVKQAIHLVHAGSGAIYLLDPAGERLVYAAGVGMPEDFRPGRSQPADAGLGGQALEEDRPKAKSHYLEWDGRLRDLDTMRFEAVAVAPVHVAGQEAGILAVHRTQPGSSFDNDDLDLLQQFANHAGLALQKGDLLDRLKAIQRSALAIAQARDLPDILTQTCRAAVELFGVEHSGLMLLEQRVGYGAVRGEHPEPIHALGSKIQVTGVPAEERLLRELDPLMVPDVAEARADLGPMTDVLLGYDIQSILIVPIAYQGKPLGSVSLDSIGHKRRFTKDEADLMSVLAAHVAVAIHNAQLKEQLLQAHEAAGTVARVTIERPLKQTLQTIVRRGREVLKADSVTLYAYDDENRRFSEWASMPEHIPAARSPEELKPDSVLWHVLNRESESPHYVESNVAQDAILRGAFTRLEGVEAAVAVRLTSRDRVVGAMFANYKTPHRFSDEEKRNTELFASQAAVAIINAHLYSEIANRAQTAEALYQAGEAINSSLDLDSILRQIAVQALALAGLSDEPGSFCALMLGAGNAFWPAAASHDDALTRIRQVLDEQKREGKPPKGIIVRAATTGETQNVEDVKSDPDYLVFDAESGSELAVPIRAGKRTIGVINVERRATGKFGAGVVQALESLANQAAMAIKNSRLYEEQQIVGEASRDADRNIEYTPLLQGLFERVHAAFEARHIPALLSVATLDHEAATLNTYQTQFYPQQPAMRTVPLNAKGIMTLVARTGTEHYAPDVAQDPHYQPLRADTRSEFCAPIRFGDTVLGVFDLESPILDAFSPEEQALARTLAHQIAAMLRNVQHYEQMKQIKGFVGSQTAVQWMRMVSAQWGHAIRREVGVARARLALVEAGVRSEEKQQALSDLGELDHTLEEIAEIPITAPLTAEDVVRPVKVNEIIAKRLGILWRQPYYARVTLHAQLQADMDEQALVWASEAWLWRAVQIVVENAVRAMLEADSPTKALTVATVARGQSIEIRVQDTGPGIPEAIRHKLFRETIEQEEGRRGVGVGAVVAGLICQAYNGSIEIEATGSQGTTIRVVLPVFKEPESQPCS
jgi:GAF domain-containing protein